MMKKYFTILLGLFAIITMSSCQKIGSENSKLDDRLVGTKWQTEDFAQKLLFGGNPYEVYEFVSTTEVECYITDRGSVIKSHGTFTYTLEYPHITINRQTSDGITPTKYTFKDSRTMLRDGADEYGYYAKYMKQ